MDNKQQLNSNDKGNGGNQQRNSNNRPKRRHESSQKNSNGQRNSQQTKRRKRVSVDRDVELVVISNSMSRIFYENPRLSIVVDLHHIGDEEYLTVGDIRTILNSNRKLIEGFKLVITDVLDPNYTLEDVLVFLGLDKKYDEYYSLSRKSMGSALGVDDIKNFLLNSPTNSFEKTMRQIDEKLRARVIEQAVALFKLKEFGDYNKMRIIEGYVNDELFADAQETEIEDDVYI